MPKKLTAQQCNFISIGFMCLCLGFVAGLITGATIIERNHLHHVEVTR